MARVRRNRRRRRGRLSFLLKLFAVAVTVAAILAAVTLFFRMDYIVISGNSRYSEQEVLAASELETGGNLYLINKFDVKERLFAQLPYVEEVKINRKLPDTLLIELRECEAVAGIESGGMIWLVNEDGKLLEQTDTLPPGCPLITGEELREPVLTGRADFGEAASYRAGVAQAVLREAAEREKRQNINSIDLSDETALKMEYLNRFTVRFPWTADIDYKLESLAYVVDQLESNQTGRIDLMTEGKASYIPG